MNSITLLQVSQSVIEKSAEMLEKDPHGAIITLVSVSVVFTALVLLYYAYTFIGKIVNGEFKPKKKVRTPSGHRYDRSARRCYLSVQSAGHRGH